MPPRASAALQNRIVYGGLTSVSRYGIQVRHVFLILRTNGLNHFGIDDRILFQCYAPGPGVGLRVVHGKVDDERPVVHPVDSQGKRLAARHIPDKSGFPSAVLGAAALRSGLASGVRGTPRVG